MSWWDSERIRTWESRLIQTVWRNMEKTRKGLSPTSKCRLLTTSETSIHEGDQRKLKSKSKRSRITVRVPEEKESGFNRRTLLAPTKTRVSIIAWDDATRSRRLNKRPRRPWFLLDHKHDASPLPSFPQASTSLYSCPCLPSSGSRCSFPSG